MKARNIMVMNVNTSPEVSATGCHILFKTRIGALPVVDGHGELIGIISEGDWRDEPLEQRKSARHDE